jgi:hypothetical protein
MMMMIGDDGDDDDDLIELMMLVEGYVRFHYYSTYCDFSHRSFCDDDVSVLLLHRILYSTRAMIL